MHLVDGRARLRLAVPASAAVIIGRKLADNPAKADKPFTGWQVKRLGNDEKRDCL